MLMLGILNAVRMVSVLDSLMTATVISSVDFWMIAVKTLMKCVLLKARNYKHNVYRLHTLHESSYFIMS